jgi:hypothetical protein
MEGTCSDKATRKKGKRRKKRSVEEMNETCTKHLRDEESTQNFLGKSDRKILLGKSMRKIYIFYY